MDKNTFGCTKTYPALNVIVDNFNAMDKRQKRYLSSIIQDFNSVLLRFENNSIHKDTQYLLDLIHEDFKLKVNKYMVNKFENKIITHLLNFFTARIRTIKRNIIENYKSTHNFIKKQNNCKHNNLKQESAMGRSIGFSCLDCGEFI